MRRVFPVVVLALAGTLLACSGGGGSGGKGGGGGGGSGGVGGSGGGGAGGTGGGDEGCPYELVDPHDGPDTGWTPVPPASFDEPLDGIARDPGCAAANGWVSAVRGWVAAPGGAPLAGAMAQVCGTTGGTSTCMAPIAVGDDGVFTVELEEGKRCLERAALRISVPRSGRAMYYRALDVHGDPAIRLEEPAVLPWARPATDLPPRGDPDEARPVVFDDGLVLQAIPSLFWSGSAANYECFGGRRIPVDAVGLVPSAREFAGLYAFYPEGALSDGAYTSPGYPLVIPNAGLPANATVELYVLGGLDCDLLDGTPVPEGEWMKFGEATVSADGATIASKAGSGLPCLNWLGYRLKD